MNKYNEIMSHVRVDDEMHRRVMSAVSKALDEQAASGNEETPAPVKAETTPIRRRAKLSTIQILSIAAAAILVGGAVYFAIKFVQGMPVKEHSKMMSAENVAQATTAAAETAVNREIEAAFDGVNAGNGNKNFIGATKTAGPEPAAEGPKEEESTASTEDEGLESTAASEEEDRNKYEYDPDAPTYYTKSKKSFKDYLPFKVKTVGTSTIGEEKIKAVVYTGEKGEKLVIYAAKEGTDIAKKVYPKFKGVPALLQTEGGQQFYAIDTSVGKKKQVNTTGPYDAVMWNKDGNTYLMTFSSKTDVNIFISLMEKI